MAIPEDPAVTATTATGALRPRDQTGHSSGVTLPPDLKAQAAHRLRIVATLYAIAFTVSSPITSIFLPQDRAAFFSSPFHWVPPLLSISSAIALIALTLGRQVAVGTVLNVGLVFQVIGSFGIAAAQYLDVTGYEFRPPWGGLSWVAVWMLGFTMMVPTPPRRALAAALGSATAVPLVVALAVARDGAPAVLTPLLFVLQIVVPYLLVVLIAYVGSRVVYHLGTALMSARELGSYRLVERLGEGGMGEVWRAEHRLLARPAAIKQMRIAGPESAEPGRHAELVARFEREAQATSRLRSPHTIELYDFGMADDGTFYYVMELLDGFDLQVLIQRFGPVPVERAAHLMQQVCHSLSEAHSVGLIHRDVKPANIYVCRYGRDVDFIKVLDFGLVKNTEPIERSPDVTAAHVARGTPAFMSPEQVLENRPVDSTTDLYALGCVGYWLVTGQLVFSGRTPMETMMHHAGTQPDPPSRRSELAITPAFDELILECLEKDPARRPASADAVAARLQQIASSNPWTPGQARAWWDLHASAPQRPTRASDAEPALVTKKPG